jgi:hypothetical protein
MDLGTIISLVRVELAETSVIRCVECGCYREDDERWYLRFSDIGELAIYCASCAEREFGGDRQTSL